MRGIRFLHEDHERICFLDRSHVYGDTIGREATVERFVLLRMTGDDDCGELSAGRIREAAVDHPLASRDEAATV